MIFWLSRKSLPMFRVAFLLGVVASLVLSTIAANSSINAPAIGLIVCLCLLGVVILMRIVSKVATGHMSPSIRNVPWERLDRGQFDSMGMPAILAFCSQLLGLTSAALAVGWMIPVMVYMALKGFV